MLARELGLTELSPEYWGFYNKQNQCQGFPNTAVQMCEKWMLEPFDGKLSADRVIKERLSLVEIGFRQHENFVAGLNAKLAEKIAAAEKFDLTFSETPAFGYTAVTAPMGYERQTPIRTLSFKWQ